MRRNLQLNPNIHAKLKEISEKRTKEGHPASTMTAVIAEMTLKLHKKECDK